MNNIRMNFRTWLTGTTAAVVLGAMPNAVLAQDSDGAEGSENFSTIIVTSKRIEQNVYEAPVAVTVFNPEALDQRNADNIIDIGKYVPNLTVTNFGAGNPSSGMFDGVLDIGFTIYDLRFTIYVIVFDLP